VRTNNIKDWTLDLPKKKKD